MTISVISFWIPLLWALAVTIYWRFKIKEPVNNWVVCLGVFAVNFFWFAYISIIFLIIAIINSFKKKEKKID